MKPNLEEIKDEIKKIIYGNAKKGFMCDDLADGQILGFRTGEGLEFDALTIGLAEWYCDKSIKLSNDIKNILIKA